MTDTQQNSSLKKEGEAVSSPESILIPSKFVPSDGIPVLFADGIAALSIAPGVARIDLFQIQTPADASGSPETRFVCQRVIIPTAAFIEFVTSVLDGLSTNGSELLKTFATSSANIASKVQSVSKG